MFSQQIADKHTKHIPMEAPGFVSVLVHMILVTGLPTSLGRTTKSHYIRQYTTTSFIDKTHKYYEGESQLATYANNSVFTFTGKLYEPPNGLLTCSEHSNITYKLPDQPFIVFVPLPTSSTKCNAYKKAQKAEELGATGIVFYSQRESSQLKLTRSSLKVVVTLVVLTEDEISLLKKEGNWTNTTIKIEIDEESSYVGNQHTFYFVVFAFTVLVILSLTWFIITYTKRCHDFITSKRRRVSGEFGDTRGCSSNNTCVTVIIVYKCMYII